MSSIFGRKSKGNVPQYPTRDEIVILYNKYYGYTPDEPTIQSHMRNPGGRAAIEQMLVNSLPTQIPITPPPITGVMAKRYDYNGVIPRGMSYWRAINQHYLSNNLTFFISVNKRIMLVQIDKKTLEVLGERYFDSIGEHEGEGCYFSALEPNILFVPMGSELRKYDIRNGSYETVMQVNGQCWQPHSDYYEHNHSCSVKRNEQIVAWSVNGREYPIKGKPDECQIDKSGNWLLCKETYGEDESNRIIYIPTGAERIINNAQGAVGHSDCGFNFVYGENDMSDLGGALDSIDFSTGTRRNITHTGVWNMGYFSYSNAKPLRQTFGLISSSDGRLIKIDIQSGISTVIHLMNTSATVYDKRAKANVCPEGEFAFYIDADLKPCIVRIP